MTGLVDDPLVWLGDLALNVVDDAGTAWVVTGLSGWSGSPASTMDVAARTGDHGGWPSPGYLQPRVMELAGYVEAPNRAALITAVDQLNAAATLGDTTLQVAEGGLDRQATVRRSGEVLVDVAQYSATWSVPLTAPDPRRYGTLQTGSTALPSTTGGLVLPAAMPWTMSAVTVPGSVTATNTGNLASRPLLLVDGPVVQPRIAAVYPDGTVRQLAYTDTLYAGEQLVIDTDAHTAMLGAGASRRRYLSGEWPEIPPGTVDIQFRAAAYDPDALLTVQWRSAWL